MATINGSTCVLFAVLIACVVNAFGDAEYQIPHPKFKLLKPQGFQASIPDESGIRLFAFHGNLNKKMLKMENGQFERDTTRKHAGKWIYQNTKLKVKTGDVIYYWLFVIKNGTGYRLDDGYYEFTDSEVYHRAKKVHKLHKRYAFGRSYAFDDDDSEVSYYPRRYHRHEPQTSVYSFPTADSDPESEENDFSQGFGRGYGHGYAHHHHRGYPYHHHHHKHTPSWANHHHHHCNHPSASPNDDDNNDSNQSSKQPKTTNEESTEPEVEPDVDVEEGVQPIPLSRPDQDDRPRPMPRQTTMRTTQTTSAPKVADVTTTTPAPNIDLRFGEAEDMLKN